MTLKSMNIFINNKKMEKPIRINKYLANNKICSRREADTLIEKGKVLVNGKLAKIGQLVLEKDEVKLAGSLERKIYLAFNKPEGIVTHSPRENERSIFDILKIKHKVYPIGRLDKQSRGLIILTNDGRITDRLLNPEQYHEKEYSVAVNKPLTEKFIKNLSRGVRLDDGYKTRECFVKEKDEFSFYITLTEGKKRQIRRMCSALGYRVEDLNRIRIMNIKLGNLSVGDYRILKEKEKNDLLKQLNLK